MEYENTANERLDLGWLFEIVIGTWMVLMKGK